MCPSAAGEACEDVKAVSFVAELIRPLVAVNNHWMEVLTEEYGDENGMPPAFGSPSGHKQVIHCGTKEIVQPYLICLQCHLFGCDTSLPSRSAPKR